MSNHLDPEILEHFEKHNESMLDIGNDMRKLQNNFEIHFQNQIRYAEEVLKISKKVDILCDSFLELKAEVNPIVQNFNGLKWSKWLLLGVIAFLASVMGLILMAKQILK